MRTELHISDCTLPKVPRHTHTLHKIAIGRAGARASPRSEINFSLIIASSRRAHYGDDTPPNRDRSLLSAT